MTTDKTSPAPAAKTASHDSIRGFHGIIPPVVTPLKDQRTLDRPGLEKLLEHIIKGGVHGLFILGTNGEGPALPYSVRRDMIKATCEIVGDRLPVLAGVTDTAPEETLDLAETAASAGARALVVAPPYYLPPEGPELLHYYEFLATRFSLPFFLYNIPSLTKAAIDENLVRESLNWENCAGLKESSGDMIHLKRVLFAARDREDRRPDYSILIGPEELLLDALLAGADGGVNGGANYFPSLFVAIYEAARAGDTTRAARLQNRWGGLASRLYRVSPHTSSVLRAIKCAVRLRGLCDDLLAEPFQPMNEAEARQIASLLEEAKGMLREEGVPAEVP